jgi:hypothetical protein
MAVLRERRVGERGDGDRVTSARHLVAAPRYGPEKSHGPGSLPRERPRRTLSALGDGHECLEQLPDPDVLRCLDNRLTGHRAGVPGGPAGRPQSKRSHLPLCAGASYLQSGAAVYIGHHSLGRSTVNPLTRQRRDRQARLLLHVTRERRCS